MAWLIGEQVNLASRLCLGVELFLELVAGSGQRAAFDALGGFGQGGHGGGVEFAPTVEGIVEIVGDLPQLDVSPGVREPRTAPLQKLLRKVLDDTGEGRPYGVEGGWRQIKPSPHGGVERHLWSIDIQ